MSRWTIQKGLDVPAECFTCNRLACKGCKHQKAFAKFEKSHKPVKAKKGGAKCGGNIMTDQEKWEWLVRDSIDNIEDSDGFSDDQAIVWANNRIKELEKAHVRYETVRKLNPVQFAKLYRKNIDSGEAFDSLVDRIASGELVL